MKENVETLPVKCNLTDMIARVIKTEYVVLPDNKTTLCILFIENGYTVHGMSSCVEPKEFNKALGEKYAYEDAIDKLWPLEGYLLAEKRFNAGLVKIEGSAENWDNRVLGADPRFARRAPKEAEDALEKALNASKQCAS